MKKLDWKGFGQFLSVFIGLFTLIRDTFNKMGVGIEIIGWVTGEGKSVFVDELLRPLGAKFLATQKPKPVKPIIVDLGAFPKLPFTGASVKSHQGTGTAKLERRGDDLYLDSRKIVLYLSERQKNGKSLKGHELYEGLTGKAVLNANILDALYEHPELIPESWKKDEQGNIRYISVWGTIYRGSGVGLCIRSLYFYDGAWSQYYVWLDSEWDDSDPAALAS